MSLLKHNITKKKQNNKLLELELKPKLNIREDNKYKVEAIKDTVVYNNIIED